MIDATSPRGGSGKNREEPFVWIGRTRDEAVDRPVLEPLPRIVVSLTLVKEGLSVREPLFTKRNV